MKVVLQRVQKAKVTAHGKVSGEIGNGLLVLVGIHQEDQRSQIRPLIEKLIHLRIFYDEEDKMNLSLLDIRGELLIVSQFTLYANCKSGRRPSFLDSAPPKKAQPLYDAFVEEAKKLVGRVETGVFGAYMNIELINDGPVTMILEG